MAVLGSQAISHRRFAGFRDSRFPVTLWFGLVSLTGDASGGTATLTLEFNPSTQSALNSNLYSLENFTFSTNEEASRVGEVSSTNMAGPPDSELANIHAVQIFAGNGLGRAAAQSEPQAMMPIFLGAQRILNAVSGIRFAYLNTNTIVYRFEAQGYMWSKRSVLADGGPMRPPWGVYKG